jgi:hypothetical protein
VGEVRERGKKNFLPLSKQINKALQFAPVWRGGQGVRFSDYHMASFFDIIHVKTWRNL